MVTASGNLYIVNSPTVTLVEDTMYGQELFSG